MCAPLHGSNSRPPEGACSAVPIEITCVTIEELIGTFESCIDSAIVPDSRVRVGPEARIWELGYRALLSQPKPPVNVFARSIAGVELGAELRLERNGTNMGCE